MKIKTLSFLTLIILASIGWILNIVKLIDCDFKAPYKAEVIRVIGIVPTVGAMVGWMDIEDGNLD